MGVNSPGRYYCNCTMYSNCHKTTELVNVQKVSRSRQIGPVAWVSTNNKTMAVNVVPPAL